MKGASTAANVKTTNGKVEKPKATKKVTKAEEAVSKYQEMRKQYVLLEDEFQEKFPQAHAHLQNIKKLEDDIRTQIDGCKILVREAGHTIGEFIFTAKATTEGYSGSKLVELIAKLEDADAGELFKELVERGFIEAVSVDKAAAKVVRASDATLRDRLAPAWDAGGVPLTPAITVPKF